MKDINETMKNLQQATEELSKLSWGNSANPWGVLGQMQDIFNRDFWSQVGHLSQREPVQPQSQAESQPQTGTSNKKSKPKAPQMPIDIFETLSKVILCCELPGLDRNSLKISLSNSSLLQIKGKRKDHDLSDYRISKERMAGRFERQIQLPCPVTTENVHTHYKDGLLEIQLSKWKPEEQWKNIKEVKFDL